MKTDTMTTMKTDTMKTDTMTTMKMDTMRMGMMTTAATRDTATVKQKRES
jgi:hypothetical protein